jgi:hypothetical protein
MCETRRRILNAGVVAVALAVAQKGHLERRRPKVKVNAIPASESDRRPPDRACLALLLTGYAVRELIVTILLAAPRDLSLALHSTLVTCRH